jgi:tetratricopeptide (TPR) repeat protein
MLALATALLCLLLLAGTTADAQPLSGAQAAQALTSDDAQMRRDAATRLGEIGTMADVALLVRSLRDPDGDTRERAEQSLWRIWARSGDPEIDQLYQTGIEQMSAGDLKQAIATFTRIIESKPDFAEGWNKRATLYYLTGELRRSLADCNEVMKRNRYHFGALSGYMLIYVRLEDYERALEYARRALDVNPNLRGVRDNMELIERALEQRRSKMI